jgi:sugar lactone lactonase YvrE
VITVAGNGTSGQNDNVLAASSGVSQPTGLAVDASGNVIFADKGDHRIRKWWANTGEISIISGTGLAGATGDGGLAGVSRNSSPEDVAVDSNGVIYIADTGLNKIRAVCPPYGSSCSVLGVTIPSGYIDTVVGGSTTAGTCANGTAATNAACRLSTPRGVKVASNGDLFIADTTNNKIGWVPKTGASSNTYGVGVVVANTMYGIVTSGLSSPQSIAIDSSNNIFIGDTSNNRIKEISPGASTVTTVAGNGSGGHCSDGATATGACVNAPTGVAVDGSSIYYVDAGAYVEKFTVGGTVSAIAGTGSAGLSGDGGGAIGAAITPIGIAKKAGGNLWIAGSSAGTNMQLRQILGPV